MPRKAVLLLHPMYLGLTHTNIMHTLQFYNVNRYQGLVNVSLLVYCCRPRKAAVDASDAFEHCGGCTQNRSFAFNAAGLEGIYSERGKYLF